MNELSDLQMLILRHLKEQDYDMPELCRLCVCEAEDIWPAIKKLMVFGKIGRNSKVVIYPKARTLWFRLMRRKASKIKR